VNFKLLCSLAILIPSLVFLGCEGDVGPEGPRGPAGEDGTDGIDGVSGVSPQSCLECHSDQATLQIAIEYVQSGHKAGEYVDYAGGRASCARCHSKQGFVQYAVNGEVAGDIVGPAAIDCSTCHSVHPSEFGLRLDAEFSLIADPAYMLDYGDASNLCANCHQSRRAEPNLDVPGETFEITSTHYGPHHGAQGILLEGVGFAEIDGSAEYPEPSSASGHLSMGATCVSCHMNNYAGGAGGHTWHPNVENCTGCHPGATDFNINNTRVEIQEKLDTLRDLLLAAGVLEYVEEDAAYEPVVGTYPMVQAQAFFNWIGIEEDRSLGVHNPRYTRALLDNSIEALTQ